MKLLVIDDNSSLVRSLKDFLGKDFVIDTAGTVKDGLQLAATTTSDVIVLDINLPDGLGSDLCHEIRAASITTPLLILTAVSDVESRVDLLNSGADDYLVKPFSLQELRARLFALLRRAPASYETTILSVNGLVMDVAKRQVHREGRKISLRRKEFDILEYLLLNKGHAVTRPMIFNHAWESDKAGWYNTVDVHIKHLRDKVDRPFNTSFIKTAYGIGYVIDDISSSNNNKGGAR